MKFPDRLDYYYDDYEDYAGEEEPPAVGGPFVHCLVRGCHWTYIAEWAEVMDDGADWDALHPAHQ